MSSINNFQLSENFNLQEFECTGEGHNHVKVCRELVDKLQELRERLGRPIMINSAFRCEERNREVGGADESQHLTGRAVDISMRNQDISHGELKSLAQGIGFTGIGLYDTFVHLDTREGQAAVWDGR